MPAELLFLLFSGHVHFFACPVFSAPLLCRYMASAGKIRFGGSPVGCCHRGQTFSASAEHFRNDKLRDHGDTDERQKSCIQKAEKRADGRNESGVYVVVYCGDTIAE